MTCLSSSLCSKINHNLNTPFHFQYLWSLKKSIQKVTFLWLSHIRTIGLLFLSKIDGLPCPIPFTKFVYFPWSVGWWVYLRGSRAVHLASDRSPLITGCLQGSSYRITYGLWQGISNTHQSPSRQLYVSRKVSVIAIRHNTGMADWTFINLFIHTYLMSCKHETKATDHLCKRDRSRVIAVAVIPSSNHATM